VLAQIFKLKRKFRTVLQEVYLLEDGETIQLIYENQFWVLELETCFYFLEETKG